VASFNLLVYFTFIITALPNTLLYFDNFSVLVKILNLLIRNLCYVLRLSLLGLISSNSLGNSYLMYLFLEYISYLV